MGKQQNLGKKVLNFLKNFIKLLRKITCFFTEFALEHYDPLNCFNHLEKYSEFSIKVLNFSGARRALPPIPPDVLFQNVVSCLNWVACGIKCCPCTISLTPFWKSTLVHILRVRNCQEKNLGTNQKVSLAAP